MLNQKSPSLWPISRAQRPRQEAVIDIGSNSVRMVVYQIDGRSMVPRMNEKVMAGLGKDLSETGRLSVSGVEAALKAPARYSAICSSLGVTHVTAIATAAARDAEDGPEFCEAIERVSGFKVRILSGVEEAKFAALGVVAAQRDPVGLIGDLGGSSLELIHTERGALGEGRTYKLGPLALQDRDEGGAAKLEAYVTETLTAQGGIAQCPNFYAVGGAWRAIASLHMELNNYPLRVLQAYTIPASEAIELCDLIMDRKKRPDSLIKSVAGKRAATLEYTALALKCVLKLSGAEQMITSANGVREGFVFDGMDPETKTLDPLFAGVSRLARLDQRQIGFARGLQVFTADILAALPSVFPDDPQTEKRLHEAAFILADIGAIMHPDHRSDIARQIVLRGPYTGTNHAGRIYLGLITGIRYYRKFEAGELEQGRLTAEQIDRAKTIALLIRVAAEFSGRTERILKRASIRIEGDQLIFALQKRHQNLISEGVIKRLGHAAAHMGLTPVVE